MNATAPDMNGVNDLLRAFLEAQEGARRFHGEAIGKDVNPRHCFGDFCLAIRRGDRGYLEKNYGATYVKTAMAESTGGATGGYLVPEELRTELMRDVGEESIFRPRALVIPMASASLLLPLPDATTTPSAAGISPFYGGIQMKWTEEAATRSETSEPKFRDLDLRAWELSGYALASLPLMQDGKGIDAFLRQLFARSIAYYEDYAFLQGTGVGQPIGILNSPAAKLVNRQTGSQFTNQDTGKMSAALIPSCWPTAIWVMSPTVFQYVTQLTGWQANQPMQDGRVKGAALPRFVLSGQDGYSTEKLPALGTKGDVILFDPRLYVIGDRQSVMIDYSRDEPTAWTKNQGVFRVIERVAGSPWLDNAVTLQDGSTSASSIVVLN